MLAVGDKLRWGTTDWTVVGIFEDRGSVAESEVWTDATVLQGAYNRGTTFQSMRVKLTSPEAYRAFEDALTATSTPWAPWYVIPADHKWLTQALVAQVLVETVRSLDLRWPEVSDAEHAANLEARKKLEAEPDE